MSLHNPLAALAESIHKAILIDLDDIHYLGNRYTKTGIAVDKPSVRRPTEYDLLSIQLFQMTFGHGSGLHGGMGTANCPTYHIVVIESKNRQTCVYQEGNLVYKILKPNDKFREDVKNHQLKIGGPKIYEEVKPTQ